MDSAPTDFPYEIRCAVCGKAHISCTKDSTGVISIKCSNCGHFVLFDLGEKKSFPSKPICKSNRKTTDLSDPNPEGHGENPSDTHVKAKDKDNGQVDGKKDKMAQNKRKRKKHKIEDKDKNKDEGESKDINRGSDSSSSQDENSGHPEKT